MADIKFKGWFTWRDWGCAYRMWVFIEGCREIKAKKGDRLFDRGPGRDPRFSVRCEDGTRLGEPSPDRVVSLLFSGFMPPWDPPRAGERLIASRLKELGAALGAFATVSRLVDTLKGLQKSIAGPQAGPTDPPKSGNQFLRLKFDGKYDNGDPYHDFELLVDVPEIPVSRTGKVTPRHAIKGDILRERCDDELTPFELCRNGRRIGDPEWWQVRHLFVGIETWHTTDDETPDSEVTTSEADERDAERYTRLDDWLAAERDDKLEGAGPAEPHADTVLESSMCEMEIAADRRRARWPRSCKTCGTEFRTGKGRECEPCKMRRLQATTTWCRPKPCRGCGKEFLPMSWNAAYCSHECKERYLEKRRAAQ